MTAIETFTPTQLLAPVQVLDYNPYRCAVCRNAQDIIYPGADQLCPRCAAATKDLSFEELQRLVADFPDMEMLDLMDDLRMAQGCRSECLAIARDADFDAQWAQGEVERIEAQIALLRATARLCAAEWV